jgi:hypothetical protein
MQYSQVIKCTWAIPCLTKQAKTELNLKHGAVAGEQRADGRFSVSAASDDGDDAQLTIEVRNCDQISKTSLGKLFKLDWKVIKLFTSTVNKYLEVFSSIIQIFKKT